MKRAFARTRSLGVRQTGQMVVMAAIFLPVMLGFTGIAIDVGMVMLQRTERQRTADAAALAGAQYLMYNPQDISGAKSEACKYAKINGYGTGTCNNSEVEVYVPPISGPNAGKDGFVEVIVKRKDETFFMRVLGVKDTTIKARAVGGSTPRKRNYALIVLNPTQCNAYNHTSSSNMTINGGGAIVNSDATTGGSCVGVGARQGGGSIVSAQNCKDKDGVEIPCTLDHNVKAQWSLSSNAQAIPPPTKAPPFPDPLTCGPPLGNQAAEYCPRPQPCLGPLGGNLSGVDTANCVPKSTCSAGTARNPRMTSINNTAATCKLGDKLILLPGTYYGGITLTEGNVKSVEFVAGIYVLAGGGGGSNGGLNCCPTSVTNLASVPGTGVTAGLTGVTFFNTDLPSANSSDRPCGKMKLTGAATLSLQAPTVPHTTVWSGYKNMLFWQSETCKNSAYGNSNNPSFDFAGGGSGANWVTSGIIYLPLAQMNVTGGGDMGSVQIIVDTFSFSGSQDVNIRFTRYIDTDTQQYKLVE